MTDKLTTRSQEAIAAALQSATQAGNPTLDTPDKAETLTYLLGFVNDVGIPSFIMKSAQK